MKRYALVTGASRGIGRAIAIELAKDGFSVLLNYKSNHAAAKSAMIGVTRALATELAPKAVTVNAVAPGLTDTDIFKQSIEYTDSRFVDVKNYPMRRLCKPEEVAYLVSFLCSNRADYISGQVIGINGAAL